MCSYHITEGIQTMEVGLGVEAEQGSKYCGDVSNSNPIYCLHCPTSTARLISTNALSKGSSYISLCKMEPEFENIAP